jgi:uncharacterized protein (UPF0332 family)
VHDDLFRQAEVLATIDAKKPKQANLRRAISAAYYAVFHFFVHEACCALVGSQHSQAAYRHTLGRAFAHGAMNQACKSFGGGSLKESVIKGLPRDASGKYPIPQAIQNAARMFADLQEKRHRADYDLTERFTRSEVLGLIEQAEVRMTAFSELPNSDEKNFFLACLWAWKELANR